MKYLHGKKYRKAAEQIDRTKRYTLSEALDLLLATSVTKFDASCEVHVNLGIDPKQSDQMIRTTVSLPHGIGKEVRVVAFVDEGKVKEALAAGAMKAGLEDLMEEVSKGFVGFDVAVATPDTMKALAKVAKILGPKGLMPNVKAGTVTTEVGKTVEEMKKGKIEFKSDKQGIVHSSFGKVSFGKEKLLENAQALLRAVTDAKPASIKGTYLKSIFVTTTMGPSLQVVTDKV